MPQTITFPVQFIRIRFHSGGHFYAPVGDPKALALEESPESAFQRYLRELTRCLREDANAGLLLREIVPGPLQRDELQLDFSAAHDNLRHPEFSLHLPYFYNEGPNQCWGIVPALGVESLGADRDQLRLHLQQASETALNRKQAENMLEKAITALWYTETDLLTEERRVEIPYPWEEENTGSGKLNWLPRLASPVLSSPRQMAFGREAELEKLSLAMRNPYRKSCVLIGASGIGKSALIYEFIRQTGKEYRVWETTAARLIKELSAKTGWQDSVQDLLQEMQDTQTILYVRQLRELFEVGKYEGNHVSLAEYLIPFISRGEFALLSECSPADRVWIERKSPGFFAAIQTIYLRTDPTKLKRIVHQKTQQLAAKQDSKVSRPAVSETLDLHRRFFPYAGEPGQSIRFLENLLRREVKPGSSLSRTQVVTHFSRQSGIPQSMIDLRAGFEREEVRQQFADQLFGQDRAIEDIVDVLAAVKNQMIRPDKPIASFLFVGPTGVGKTELAKILAGYMFGHRNRMQRFDMSEFSNRSAVYRLTTPGSGLLTNAIRRNPFSVLLFDELEKAHPDFFDLLLQILGEGRLTDQSGRLVNFCSTIIIMTSNIGATAAGRRGLSIQQQDEFSRWRDHYLRAVEKQLRPELVNRIDRITPFDPLGPRSIRRVVDREIRALQLREGIQHRRIDLEIAEDVLDSLAIRGYDPRMGARQLQRTLRRELIIPLAKALNMAPTDEHLIVKVQANPETVLQVDVETDPLNVELWLEEYEKVRVCEHIANLRRELHRCRQANVYVHLQSEIEILERHLHNDQKSFWKHPDWPRTYNELVQLQSAFGEMQGRIDKLEEEISLANFGLTPYQPGIMSRVDQWELDFLNLRWSIHAHLNPGNNDMKVAVYGKNPQPLAAFYSRLFRELQYEYTLELGVLQQEQGESELKYFAWEPDDSFDDWDRVYKWQAHVKGRAAEVMLAGESGLQEIRPSKGTPSRYWVSVGRRQPIPPGNLLRMETYAGTPRRIFRPGQFKDADYGLSGAIGKEGAVPLILEHLRKIFSREVESRWI